ncbi:hypothetical protein HDU67_003960, partial [Dinochytrium kinnereticum]
MVEDVPMFSAFEQSSQAFPFSDSIQQEPFPFGGASPSKENAFVSGQQAWDSQSHTQKSPARGQSPYFERRGRSPGPGGDKRGRSLDRNVTFETDHQNPAASYSSGGEPPRAASPAKPPISPSRPNASHIPSPKRPTPVDTSMALARARSVSPIRPPSAIAQSPRDTESVESLQAKIMLLEANLAKALSEKQVMEWSKEGQSTVAEQIALERQLTETKRIMEENVHERLQFQKKCQDLIAERDGLLSEVSQLHVQVNASRSQTSTLAEIDKAKKELESLRTRLDEQEESLRRKEESLNSKEQMLEVRSRHLTSTE